MKLMNAVLLHMTPSSLDILELDSRNVLLKIQIWELLSAMCVFNEEGHTTVLEALEFYKVSLLYA